MCEEERSRNTKKKNKTIVYLPILGEQSASQISHSQSSKGSQGGSEVRTSRSRSPFRRGPTSSSKGTNRSKSHGRSSSKPRRRKRFHRSSKLTQSMGELRTVQPLSTSTSSSSKSSRRSSRRIAGDANDTLCIVANPLLAFAADPKYASHPVLSPKRATAESHVSEYLERSSKSQKRLSRKMQKIQIVHNPLLSYANDPKYASSPILSPKSAVEAQPLDLPASSKGKGKGNRGSRIAKAGQLLSPIRTLRKAQAEEEEVHVVNPLLGRSSSVSKLSRKHQLKKASPVLTPSNSGTSSEPLEYGKFVNCCTT